eukprot:scaffold103900_cov25-Tisochrysis_lutea.AAC.1
MQPFWAGFTIVQRHTGNISRRALLPMLPHTKLTGLCFLPCVLCLVVKRNGAVARVAVHVRWNGAIARVAVHGGYAVLPVPPHLLPRFEDALLLIWTASREGPGGADPGGPDDSGHSTKGRATRGKKRNGEPFHHELEKSYFGPCQGQGLPQGLHKSIRRFWAF